MNISQRVRPSSRLMFGILLISAMLLIAACQPIVDPALLEQQNSGEASSTEDVFEVEPAKATINASSLRVREGPSDAYELVAGVKEGETYDVLAISSDGAWIQLAIERAEDGQGWASTEFVTLEGDITNIATVPAETSSTDEASSSEQVADSDEAADSGEESDSGEAADSGEESDSAEAADSGEETVSSGAALGQALIQTPLPLRVRSEPSDAADNKIGSVYNLETYPVLEISDDGNWIKIDVPKLSDSGGWVWWENVVLSGDVAAEPASTTDAAEVDDAETDATDTTEADDEETDVADVEAETEGAEEAAPDEESDSTPTKEDVAAAVQAFIETPLPLRVRSAPTAAVENKIGNVFDGESYPVLEISQDGLWVKIHVPELAEDGGWVSAEYVIMGE